MPNDNVSGNVNGDLISRTEAMDIVQSMTISLGGKEIFHPEAKKSVLCALDELPAIDAVPVVRCKDCKHYDHGICTEIEYIMDGYYRGLVEIKRPDDFCSIGAKMELGEEI